MWQTFAEGGTSFTKGAYSLGKVVWGKGWEELLKLLDYCKNTAAPCPAVAIDCFGDGEARRTVSSALFREMNSCMQGRHNLANLLASVGA